MNVLLVEPDYYSMYPPLGLLKLASYHQSHGNNIEYVRGLSMFIYKPDEINITSLFTYSWKPVHDAIKFYHHMFPEVPIRVGGIYATLMPWNIGRDFPFVKVHLGLHPEAENYLPDYETLKQVSKWKDWDLYHRTASTAYRVGARMCIASSNVDASSILLIKAL